MSPNGLRRWRRYAKKCRYRSRKEGKVSNATGASLRALFFAARIHPNYAVPPKPFTSRSIVGMSGSAKKRAVRREFDSVPCPDYISTTQDRMQWYLLRGPYLRSKYHIGERLRPCPGCCACGVIEPGNEYQIPWCDGSGVLPARRP